MILREATRDDLRPLAALCLRSWPRLGAPHRTDALAWLRALRGTGGRITVLWQDGQLLAAVIARPVETDRGGAYHIPAWVVDQDRADWLALADAIVLYSCNIAMSEGRRIVLSERDPRATGAYYGRDLLGMEAEDVGVDTAGGPSGLHQRGDAQAIAQAVLDRNPEWRSSL